jgi:very-short-patch-repair endonuclease
MRARGSALTPERRLREGGVSGVETHAKVHGREVDFLWRDSNLAVEVDGWDAHKSRAAFERDRAKWAYLKSLGTDVMPIGAQRLKRQPESVLGEILSLLRRAA